MTKSNQIYTFPNGFRIIHERPSSKLHISSVKLFCDVGSVYENDKIRGVSHFIEHMCFKGTKLMPNSKDILVEFDRMGADFNAYTEKRVTCYYVKCGDKHIEKCLFILSDMLMNSAFDKEEFSKEYKVVVEENIKNENDTDVIINENLDKLLYKNSSFENQIDTLSYHKKLLNYNDGVEYYKLFYIPNRMALSIVTNTSIDTIKNYIHKSFFTNNLISNYTHLPRINYTIVPQNGIQYNIQTKKGITTTLLSIGLRTCSDLSPDKYPLNILKKILNGLSGKLSTILREDNGLTYSSSADTNYYEHLGDFVIYAETDYKKILKNGIKDGVLPLLVNLLVDLVKNGITDHEVNIAKESKKESLMLNLEDTDNIAEYNGLKLILSNNIQDNITPYENIYNTYYKNITKKDVNDVIQKYFRPEFTNVCLLGNNVPSLRTIENKFRIFTEL